VYLDDVVVVKWWVKEKYINQSDYCTRFRGRIYVVWFFLEVPYHSLSNVITKKSGPGGQIKE
jgi:hypothetical protein